MELLGSHVRVARGVTEEKTEETLFLVAPWKPEKKVKSGWYVIATKTASAALEEIPGNF